VFFKEKGSCIDGDPLAESIVSKHKQKKSSSLGCFARN
jgi:hypothetical protein